MSFVRDRDLARTYGEDRPRMLSETSLTRRQEGILATLFGSMALISLLLYLILQ